MAKKFKKNQPIVATLPTGRVVKGFYIEPYGENGHSFYVNEYEGMMGSKEIYKKATYGVKDESIEPLVSNEPSKPSEKQYEAWVKRSKDLEKRIEDDNKEMESYINVTGDENNIICQRLRKKIERNEKKLNDINAKIEEYEQKES